ncbi:hypothetical protein FJZ53_05075 [Candidatus Woesearchaeota archaeon]|nr:hypothetical protein [Candidatus Woesearchaeota archaeon]
MSAELRDDGYKSNPKPETKVSIQEYGILLGRKPNSKDLRDPVHFKEIYRGLIESEDDNQILLRAQKNFEKKGYEVLTVRLKVEGKISLEDTLEVKVTNSLLRPSSEGTLGCDFEL